MRRTRNASSPTALADFAACADPAALENSKARYLGKAGALTELLKALGKLPAAERPAAGARINEAKGRLEAALDARREALARARARARSSPPRRSTSRCRAAAAAPAACIRSPARWSASRRSSARSASRSPTAPRSRTTATTSPRSTRRRTIRRARCTTRSTSKAATCCARTPRRCRCATWKRTRRRSRSSRRAASIASTATPRIRRCSTRSRACGSTRTCRFADLKGVVTEFLRQFFERDDLQGALPAVVLPVHRALGRDRHELRRRRWLEIAGAGQVHPNVLRTVGIDPERYRASRSAWASSAWRCCATASTTCAVLRERPALPEAVRLSAGMRR